MNSQSIWQEQRQKMSPIAGTACDNRAPLSGDPRLENGIGNLSWADSGCASATRRDVVTR